MRRNLGVLLLLVGSFILPIAAHASAQTPDVFITEIQTASAQAASEEFIEIYNNTDNEIDFADSANQGAKVWKLQYYSSTKVSQSNFSWDSTDPSGAFDLTGRVAAHDYYLISTNTDGDAYAPGGITPDQTYSSSHLADSGGAVRLVDVVDSSTNEHDHAGWSNGSPLLVGFYATPPAGSSLQRTVSSEGNYINPEGTLSPFVQDASITPKAAWQQPAPANPEPTSTSGDPGVGAGEETPQISDSPETLQLTELLANPASPATDAKDEFVEIYNYGDDPVELTSFTIQTGNTYSYSYTISEGEIGPHSYVVYTSGDTTLSLANSGGKARLLNPDGEVISETSPYSEADEGTAWAFANEIWQWTTTPTPGSANQITSPLSAVAKAAAAKKVSKTAKTTAKPKTSSVKAAKSSAAGNGGSDEAGTDEQPTSLHPNILAAIGGVALVYGAYEYRQDVANRFHQLRKYRETRRAARAATAGR